MVPSVIYGFGQNGHSNNNRFWLVHPLPMP